MEDHHKECLLKNRSFMCREISLSTGLFAKLTESGVITDEHLQKLQNIIRNETMAAAVLYFLTELLPKRGPEAFDLFLKALCESEQRHVAERLKQWMSDDCSEDAGTFEGLRSELQSYYKRKLASIRPMPWLQSIYLNLTDVFVERQLKLKTNYKGDERIVTMDDLFTPQETEEIPRRLLIEGNPGIGKSTICQTLAHEWGKQSCGGHCGTLCVHSFDLVLYFHAGDFIDEESVAHAVQKHLLPSDCRITTSELQGIIEAKNVLIIVDAFDEANAGNRTLDRLIKGDILRHKTLLITSRPNFLENKQRHFESRFTVEGYDEEEQLEHVKQLSSTFIVGAQSAAEGEC
uniref:CARD domain-containing protein n=1 Tax=Capitella teleta TaxID=283909 RepID=X1ZLY6_CAPTE